MREGRQVVSGGGHRGRLQPGSSGVFHPSLWSGCHGKPHLSIRNPELSAAEWRLIIHPGGEPIFSPLLSSSKRTQRMIELPPESTPDNCSLHEQGQCKAQMALDGGTVCGGECPGELGIPITSILNHMLFW